MRMGVGDSLARVTARIKDNAVTGVGDTLGDRHLMCLRRDLSEQPVAGSGQAGQVAMVRFWNDEHVNRRLRVDIAECERALGFQDARRRQFAGRDFAE